MTFGRPAALLLLAIPVLLILWETLRTHRPVKLPFDYGQAPSGRWLARMVYFSHLMPPILLAIAILIYCRPLRQAKPDSRKRDLTNIRIVVGRFRQHDFAVWLRWFTLHDASIAAMSEFTSRRKGDAFGLAIFGNEVLQWAPLTKDLSALRSAAPFLRPESLPPQFGGTEIGKDGCAYCARWGLADARRRRSPDSDP